MLIPLTHERMTVQRLPWVTIGIIAMNFVVFAFTWPTAKQDDVRRTEAWEELVAYAEAHPGVWEDDCARCPGRADFDALRERLEDVASEHVFSRYGYVPGKPTLRGLFGSIFLHAGWSHLLWNMYFLWLDGCSIEDLWGRPLYAVVYLTGGVAAALAQGAYEPDALGPLVGASGAISALTGVFLIRCWDTRIRFFWMFIVFFGTFHAPAWIMLGFWLMKELFNAFVYAGVSSVAFWAHIGGFVFGAIVASVVKLTRVEENILAPALDRKTNLLGRHPKAARALELMEEGDYSTATRALKSAIQEAPQDSDSYRLLRTVLSGARSSGRSDALAPSGAKASRPSAGRRPRGRDLSRAGQHRACALTDAERAFLRGDLSHGDRKRRPRRPSLSTAARGRAGAHDAAASRSRACRALSGRAGHEILNMAPRRTTNGARSSRINAPCSAKRRPPS